jgi:uncharacterized protein (DUF433 family)
MPPGSPGRFAARPGNGFTFPPSARDTGVVTADRLELISTDPRRMHGQAFIAGTRVPVSVILDCPAVDMTAGEVIAEHSTITVAGERAAAASCAAPTLEELLPLPRG